MVGINLVVGGFRRGGNRDVGFQYEIVLSIIALSSYRTPNVHQLFGRSGRGSYLRGS